LNKIYEREVIPEECFTIKASAELSPKQDITKGLGDPLNYPYHDKLFQAWQERWNRLSPEEILEAYINGDLHTLLQVQRIPNVDSPEDFIKDLERWWELFKGMGVAKRVQAPPVLAVSRRAYGFDLRESLNCVHYTKKYMEMKNQILKKEGMR